MGRLLFKVESFHNQGGGSVGPSIETFVRARSTKAARDYLSGLFNAATSSILLSMCSDHPPVDAVVFDI